MSLRQDHEFRWQQYEKAYQMFNSGKMTKKKFKKISDKNTVALMKYVSKLGGCGQVRGYSSRLD